MENYFNVGVSLLEFFLNILVLGGIGIWRLAKAESDITQKVKLTIEAYRRENQVSVDDLKERKAQLERWVLSDFVRREDMRAAIEQLSNTMTALGDRIDVRMSRIEDKLDKLQR